MADSYPQIPTPDSVKQLLEAGSGISGRFIDGHAGRPVVIVPEKWRLETLNVPPERVERTVGFTDVESFAVYVNRFKTGGTLLFATVTDTDCKIVAHLDHHDKPVLEAVARERRWSSHTASLVCVQTHEWKNWLGHNGAKGNNGGAFSQVDFAQFLEDNERVFRSPAALDLLELVMTLQGKNNVRFNTAVRLSNGKAKLDYEEDVSLTGGAGAGAIEVPTELICGIIPFENGPEPYAVRSRLRYRIANRQISFWYEINTPHLALRDAARAVMDSVREKVAAPLLIGG
jgi:uncharacterized protein YfdQ (DUF2303 family)